MLAPASWLSGMCLLLGEKVRGRQAAKYLRRQQGSGRGDERPGGDGGGGDEIEAGRQLAGEFGCRGETERGTGQRAGQADDQPLGDDEPAQRRLPPAERADGGELGGPLADVQEEHVGDG